MAAADRPGSRIVCENALQVLARIATVLAIVWLGGAAWAQSRPIVGARNLAMGGTGVGSASDAVASYYNPAGMAFSHGWEIQVPLVAVEGEIEGDILDTISDINQHFAESDLTEIQARLDSGTATAEDLDTVLDVFLHELPSLDTTEDGALVRVAIGPAFRSKNWGVSAFVTGSGGVDALVDLTTGISLSSAGISGAIPDPVPADSCGNDPICLSFADDLVQETGIDTARAEVLVATSIDHLKEDPLAFAILTDIVNATTSGDATLADNPSEINATGIAIGQATFTYSRLVYREKLSVGGNIKIMSGRTYYSAKRVADLDPDDDFQSYFDGDNTRSEIQPGLDVGVMYRPTPRWSFGVAASNINTPTFDLAGIGRSVEFRPRFRGGAAWRPLGWFNVAVDLDLNEVESAIIRRLDQQYANFGAEFLIGRWFAGRVGVYRNLALEGSSPVYTGGLSFGIGRFAIDLAVGAAADRAKFESGTSVAVVPKGFAASVQFSWRPKPPAS
jgi:hypothetical protein